MSQQPVWLITGTSNGFGAAIAQTALQRGYKVIATARNPSKLSSLQSAGATTLSLDVTWPLDKIKETIASAHKTHGRIDILVNAAGYILEGAVEETSPEETYAQFNTNVFGTMNVTRAVLPYMRTQRSGVIANFGSLGSWRGGPVFANYAATKWAISGITESLKPELAPFNIDAVVIEPGYFRSNFLSEDARVRSQARIQDYEETVAGQLRKVLDATANKQLGNVAKGAEVIVDVLTKTGVAEGREMPVRLVLGSDCQKEIRGKLRETEELLDDWKEVSYSTDYPEAE